MVYLADIRPVHHRFIEPLLVLKSEPGHRWWTLAPAIEVYIVLARVEEAHPWAATPKVNIELARVKFEPVADRPSAITSEVYIVLACVEK